MNKGQKDNGTDMVATDARAMSFVRTGKDTILTKPVEALSDDEVVGAFVVVTRAGNAVDRRRAALRKRVDVLMTDREIPGSKETRLQVGQFVVVRDNKKFGEKIVDEQKTLALLKRKKVGAENVYDTPPTPPPFFSEEKVLAMKKLGMISEAEYQAILVDAKPAYATTVELPEPVDEAITTALLGSPPKVRRLGTKKG